MRNSLFLSGLAIASVAVSPLMAEQYATEHYTAEDARTGARLRSDASIVISVLFFPCHRSAVLEAPLARYEAFKAGLRSPQHKVDLTIAEADFDYQMSLVDILCPDPDAPGTILKDEVSASFVTGVLDRMETIVAADTARDENGED